MRLRLRVRPGARAAGVAGWRADGVLQVTVREPAEDGRANRAVVELLAQRLGLARGEVEIVHGAGSRDKLVEIRGLDEPTVRARLDRAEGES